jgi:hypothetical protein
MRVALHRQIVDKQYQNIETNLPPQFCKNWQIKGPLVTYCHRKHDHLPDGQTAEGQWLHWIFWNKPMLNTAPEPPSPALTQVRPWQEGFRNFSGQVVNTAKSKLDDT